MKNFIGVGVPDSREEMRVGERSLERMSFPGQGFAKIPGRCGEDVESAEVEFLQGSIALDGMQRGTLLRARFGEEQAAAGKIKGGMPAFARDGNSTLLPLEATGNHQMKNEIELVCEIQDDSLADQVDTQNGLPFEIAQRRRDGFEKARALDPNRLDRLSLESCFERFHINRQIRKFRQRDRSPGSPHRSHGVGRPSPTAHTEHSDGRRGQSALRDWTQLGMAV